MISRRNFIKGIIGATIAVSSGTLDASRKNAAIACSPGENESQGYLTTGFRDIDKLITGLHPGELVIVAGIPTINKYAFISSIARHVAVELRKPVAFFSLGRLNEQLAFSMLAAECRLLMNLENMRSSKWVKLAEATGRLSNAPIYIYDAPTIIAQDCFKILQESGQQTPSLIVIEHLDFLSSDRKVTSKNEERADITEALKELAQKTGSTVIAAMTVKRQANLKKRPDLTDSRIAAIEQYVDKLFLLHRNWETFPVPPDELWAEVIVAKNRCGATGSIYLAFCADRQYSIAYRDMA